MDNRIESWLHVFEIRKVNPMKRYLVLPVAVLLALGFNTSRVGMKAAPAFACPAAGTWPGPNGPHYLNQFNDGACGVAIEPATFPDSAAGTPASLTMNAGTWTVQEAVHFLPGTTVTVDGGATIDYAYVSNHSSPDAYIEVNGTMTFEPGSHSTASCAQCGLVVDEYPGSGNYGTLNVDGTSTLPVTMSGPSAGSWGGIGILGHSSASIDYLQLSGAGAPGSDYGYSATAGIYMDGNASQNISPAVTIKDTTISDTAGNGIEVDWGGFPNPSLSNLTLNTITGYPLQYDFLTPNLTSITGLKLSGNGHNGVRLVDPGGATSSTYGTNVTWPNLGYPVIDDILTTAAQERS